mgnify:FL=1
MRKNDKKQRRSLLFSTAVVVTGCLLTAFYVNREMPKSEYEVDLSQLSGEQKQEDLTGDIRTEGAGIARVTGNDVKNPVHLPETDTEEKSVKDGKQKITESQDGTKQQTSSNTDQSGQQTPQDGEQMQQDNTEEDKIQSQNDTDEQQKDTSGQQSSAAEETTETAAAVLTFSPEDGMTWPVSGDVILNYSMDAAVYFQTLEQYKYNPAIYISATEGTPVSACAKGVVKEIGTDAQLGQYVVTSLGSGYEVIYGQLTDLQVEEGTTVARGQVIGNVAKTTKYFSVEGDHVYLEILKDGTPVDPLQLLQ